MNTENVILWCAAVILWLAVIVYILWGVQVVRTVAVWVGGKVANLFFGRVPGGRK